MLLLGSNFTLELRTLNLHSNILSHINIEWDARERIKKRKKLTICSGDASRHWVTFALFIGLISIVDRRCPMNADCWSLIAILLGPSINYSNQQTLSRINQIVTSIRSPVHFANRRRQLNFEVRRRATGCRCALLSNDAIQFGQCNWTLQPMQSISMLMPFVQVNELGWCERQLISILCVWVSQPWELLIYNVEINNDYPWARTHKCKRELNDVPWPWSCRNIRTFGYSNIRTSNCIRRTGRTVVGEAFGLPISCQLTIRQAQVVCLLFICISCSASVAVFVVWLRWHRFGCTCRVRVHFISSFIIISVPLLGGSATGRAVATCCTTWTDKRHCLSGMFWHLCLMQLVVVRSICGQLCNNNPESMPCIPSGH